MLQQPIRKSRATLFPCSKKYGVQGGVGNARYTCRFRPLDDNPYAAKQEGQEGPDGPAFRLRPADNERLRESRTGAESWCREFRVNLAIRAMNFSILTGPTFDIRGEPVPTKNSVLIDFVDFSVGAQVALPV